ncbi:hypothetical protein, partial [Phenylobacterium sp.]|uniref:hypothetical protein n=1 Tax=Phenylobacterium sp. TaxID=1871053 RepID=UPI002F422391
DANWYAIVNNTMMNWDDYSGPNLSAAPYATQNPSDLKVRNLRIWGKADTRYGGDRSPVIPGPANWVAPAVGGVSPTLHVKMPGLVYADGGKRQLSHVLNTVDGVQYGYGALFKAVAAQSGTLVVKTTATAGGNASAIGAILSPYEWAWMLVASGQATVGFACAGGDVIVSGYGAGPKTIVRSWDTGVTKGCISGGTVASMANGNLSYLGERMNVGLSWYGDNPFDGVIDEIVFYPHASALSDAAMQAL